LAVALRAPGDVTATSLMKPNEIGQVLVTWSTPVCSHTSGLIETFVVEFCIVDSRSKCTGPQRDSSASFTRL